MRFKKQEDRIPTIDLIPMLTVMMGVLSFFVVISASFNSEQLIQVNLPLAQKDALPLEDAIADPFIVSMDASGQQLLNGVPMSPNQLAAEVNAHLSQNPTDVVYLVPSRELPYEQVMQFLGDMRAVGGDRVSLALEKESTGE